jgi:acyl transferase domain-containing protein
MIHRNLAISLATAGVYIGGALAMKAVEKAGYMPHDTTFRAYGVFTGLTLAIYANFLPKSLGTFRDPVSAQRMEQVLRVSGWAFMLGGLGYALTSILPLPDTVPMALLGTATAYVLGYSAWAYLEHGPRKGSPT